MSGVRLEGDVRRLQKALKNLSEVDIKALKKAIGTSLRDSTVERFKESKDPDDKAWKPSRNSILNNKKTLVDSSRLRNSIKPKETKTGVAVGTNTIYAATHQFGEKGRIIRPKNAKALTFQIDGKWRRAKKVKIKIPARPFMGISEEDMAEITSMTLKTVEEASRGD